MDKRTKFYIVIGGVVTISAIILLFGKKAAASVIGDTATYDDLLPIVNKYSALYGVPQALIFAIMQQESGAYWLGKGYFNTKASLMKNPTEIKAGGSQGLMQILLSSAKTLGYTGDAVGLYNPDTGIKYGVLYIKYIHDHFGVDYSDVSDIASYYNSNRDELNAPISTETVYIPHVMSYYSYYSNLLSQLGILSPQAQATLTTKNLSNDGILTNSGSSSIFNSLTSLL